MGPSICRVSYIANECMVTGAEMNSVVDARHGRAL
jgi:hypothetical protein